MVIAFLILSFAVANSLQRDIQTNQDKIRKNINEEKRINKKINALGQEIRVQSKNLKGIIEQIQVLEKELEDNQARFAQQEKDLFSVKEQEQSLQKRDEEIQQQITQLVAQKLAFRVIVNQKQITSAEGLIAQEFFQTMSREAKNKISFLTQEKMRLGVEIGKHSVEVERLQGLIAQQNEKRKLLGKRLDERNGLIKKLQTDIQNYNQRLVIISQERANLDEILEKLNIKKRNLEAIARNKKDAKKDGFSAPLEVKQMASSYRQVSTTKYYGKTTIAPLEKYEIEQKFGAYFDPVYQIKVFNESVIMTPKHSGANVRSVLGGKVVFAKDTPVLKKVVIIEHANQLHTIYAYLDKIAPTIRPGLRIKKGYVIGKVDNKLGFEVTQKDKHIDPLELFR
ncbi:hypothetical protein BBW65_01595 [Helicobacter enhydrae]|uniref:M23ase beta-sheet core domain-containing protein n=1 Tax=Helicobacter enhydrae TaxID=222136 RepID=A0A1B1U7G5_9HELI|nr:hypothetical protein BBW65_01595 [Helicobacter enhydrae]